MASNKGIVFVIAVIVIANSIVWFSVARSVGLYDTSSLFFLDVGQGDASLLTLPGNVQILIDGGPRNGLALRRIQEILPQGDRYIDMVMMSHPQADHFGGFLDVVSEYDVGAFVGNGIPGESNIYHELVSALHDKKIPYIQINTGDAIRYKNYDFAILNPVQGFFPKDPNDASVVTRFSDGNGLGVLFTGDISIAMEQKLIARGTGLVSDILKVPHHGSKFSSGNAFLKAVSPRLAVVSVGKNNYGHPTKEALDRINVFAENIVRTDINGTIKIRIHND
ncbi:MAG: MBL fold metallo-hydrolase [Patescibacteria group bacterium]